MNAQQLKKSILHYAIQGKLVLQYLNDEPANILIKKIKAEKEELVKRKIVKKTNSLPLIHENEIPFEIPQSWEWTRIGTISNYIKAGGDKPNEFLKEKTDKHHIPVIANGETNEGIIGYTTAASEEGGCITVSGRGTIGYSCIRNEPFFPIVRLIVIKPNAHLDLEYLQIVLEALLENGVGTSIKQLTVPMLSPKLIPLPPINEQKRIVTKVKELLEKVDQYDRYEKEITKLNNNFPEELKKSFLQYAMQGKLVSQDINDEPASILLGKITKEKEKLVKQKIIKKEKDFSPITIEEIPFEIPRNWVWTQLGEVSSKIHYGYTASAQDRGNAKLLRITDIQNNLVNWENVPYCDIEGEKLDSLILKNRDILIARTGGTIGKSFLISNVKGISVFASYLIRVQPSTDINEKYLTYYLRSELYWSQLRKMSAGTGQPNVNAQNLKKLLLPLPPLEEQERIVSKIEELFFVSEQLEMKDLKKILVSTIT